MIIGKIMININKSVIVNYKINQNLSPLILLAN